MIRLNINNHENLIDQIQESALQVSLSQNYPNPFSQETRIDYSLAEATSVTFEIRDISGKLISQSDQGTRQAGRQSLILSNAGMEAGFYFYTIRAGKSSITKKMMVTK
jgi:hypothetical protein